MREQMRRRLIEKMANTAVEKVKSAVSAWFTDVPLPCQQRAAARRCASRPSNSEPAPANKAL
jgi:hypothetical protein